jgi:hypothetical protein
MGLYNKISINCFLFLFFSQLDVLEELFFNDVLIEHKSMQI